MTRRESLVLGLGLGIAAKAQTPKVHTVAIIGHTGHGNYGHAWDLAWNGVFSAQVVAVADPSETGRARAQTRSGALRAYADYRQMLERERPGIVCIASRWTDELLPMFRAAAEAGAHMIVEKPFAASLPDADEMVALAARRHLKVATGHQARASETLARIRRIIQNGEIGQIVELRARGKEDGRAGGEDLAVLGTHCLDLMRVFAGDPRWVFAHVTQDGREVTPRDGRQGTERVGLLAGDQISVGDSDRASHAMALDMIDAIERDRDPVCTARDGCWTIEMIAGVYRSQFSGARLRFPLSDRSDPFAL
jgi:predicted dehydrogenase